MTRDDPAAFAPPPAFGPFRVLHQIGVGVLGPVFRTYEPTRDRLVAVKVFRLDITPEQSQELADELSRATDAGLFHPSIVEPIAAGVEGTVAYRAEEYVAGESMDVAIRHYAPAALDTALPFLTQLAGAIDFARAAGVGHGALHLRDIFLTPDEARASGFGVVDALERVGMRAPVRRPYSAPERIAGEAWSTPADVFSLAAIAYELLTGRRPAGTGEQIGALTGDTVGEHAAAIRAVLARAMDDDPSMRYSSALGFASALEAAARGEHVTGALRDMSAISAVQPPQPNLDVPEEEEDDETAELDDDAVVDGDVPDAEPDVLTAGGYVDAIDADIGDGQPEREVDVAHYDLLRDEPEAGLTQSSSLLDDDESAADRAIEEGRAEAFADEFSVAMREDASVAPDRPGLPAEHHGARVQLMPTQGIEGDSDPDMLTPSELERPRQAMLPLAMAFLLGLLLGVAAGYALWRDVPSLAGTPAQTTAAQPPVAGAQPQGAQSGKEFSEQAVAPPSPPDGTAASARQGASNARGSTPARPVATTGSIVVRSTPSGAPVTVNGRWSGRTPLPIEGLKFGPYTIRVVQPGYAVAREDITLTASDPTRALSFRLQRSPAAATRTEPPAAAPDVRPPSPERGAAYAGVLYVDSRPRGATILIDGKPYGTTPSRIPDIAVGSHVVRLVLAGHRPWTTSTRVIAGQEAVVTGSLERIQ